MRRGPTSSTDPSRFDVPVLAQSDEDGDGVFERTRRYMVGSRGDVLGVVEERSVTGGSYECAEIVRYSAGGVPRVIGHFGADMNESGGVPDEADIGAFFLLYGAGDPRADFNGSGGVPDDADVVLFFQVWDAGIGQGTADDNRFGWRGYMWDARLGLYHVRHRVYDPWSMSWLQRDPAWFKDSLNRYAYCRGDLENGYDPYGLNWITDYTDSFGDGVREIVDLFDGTAAEEDARWAEANAQTREMQREIVHHLIDTGRWSREQADYYDYIQDRELGTDIQYLERKRQREYDDIQGTIEVALVATGPLSRGVMGAIEYGVARRTAARAAALGAGTRYSASAIDGIIYRRTNPVTGAQYIGRADSAKHYLARQRFHDSRLGYRHYYDVVDRAPRGTPLRVAEESAIRREGGPSRYGGRLQNERWEMNDIDYRRCGGTTPSPPGVHRP